MKRRIQGRELLQRTPGEPFKAFVPDPLPPNPAIQMSGDLTDVLERANRAIGRLDGLSVLIPDISMFLYFYVRKEAVLSITDRGNAIFTVGPTSI